MRAFITGVTGQDGSYLAEHLLEQGHHVWGLVRGQDNPKTEWIRGVCPDLRLMTGDLMDYGSIAEVLRHVKPDHVYNLGAVSAPNMAWNQPELTAQITGLGALRLFEAVKHYAPEAKVLQASSIAQHGPYGAAKLYAHTIARDYRERGLHISCAVMGGHHSPRRGLSFFSRKVTRAVAEIHLGLRQQLVLGNLERKQDWGWATDFVTQFPRILELEPSDYVMSTGDPRFVANWVHEAFRQVGLDWSKYLVIDPSVGNVTDVKSLTAFPDPRLKWEPNLDFEGLVQSMVMADFNDLGGGK